MIKNIIFDIGNVLVTYDWKSYLKSYGFAPEKEKTIANCLFLSPLWNELDRGVLSMKELTDRFVAQAPQYEEDIRRVFQNSGQTISRRDFAIPWIEELKSRGFHVYYLSNYSDHMYRASIDALDFLPHLEGGIFSYRVQQIKPNADIFQSLLLAYPNIVPEESVFFDDTPANIEAAANLDFNAVLFKNQEQAKRVLEHLISYQNR